MSFLLRRSKQKVGKTLGGPSNCQGLSNSFLVGKAKAFSRVAQGQGQVLLQRQSQTSNKSSSLQRQVGQKQATNKQEQTQNDVSMAEVMANIREFEEQQKESQRKLESVRQMKEHKLQRRLSFEKSFEKCKYSNGEQRVQLGRARELLSSTNRLIGSKRLKEDRSSDDLRAFGALIKEGLLAVRINNEYKRKAEATLLFSIGKANTQSKQLEEVLKQPKKLETLRDEAKKKLESLRQQVYVEVAKARQHSEKVSETRSELSTLEHDLSKAQQMEASTRMHAESLDSELLNESKQYTKELDTMRRQIEANKQAKEDNETMAMTAQSSIDQVKERLIVLQAQMVRIQKAEVSDSRESVIVNDIDMVDFDLSNISSSLKAEQERRSAFTNEKQRLLDSIESAKKAEVQLSERESMLQEQTTETMKYAAELRATETKRRQAMDEHMQELETASNELSRLHQSFSELNEVRANHRNMAGEQAEAQKKKIENERQELASLRSQVNGKMASIETLKEQMATTKQSNEATILELNQRYDEAQKRLDDAKEIMTASEAAEEEYCLIQKEIKIEIEDTKKANGAIGTLLQDYEEIQNLEFSYDPSSSTDTQAERVLQVLVRSLEKRVESARKGREAARHDRRIAKEQQQKDEAKRRRKERKELEARKPQVGKEHKRKIQEVSATRKSQEAAERRAKEEEERKNKETECERLLKVREEDNARSLARRKDDEERKLDEAKEAERSKANGDKGGEEAKHYPCPESEELEKQFEADKPVVEDCNSKKESMPHTNRDRILGWDSNDRERSTKIFREASGYETDGEMPTDNDSFIPSPITTMDTGSNAKTHSQTFESSQKRVRWQVDSDEESLYSPPKISYSPNRCDNRTRRQFGTKGREIVEPANSNQRTTTASFKKSSLEGLGRAPKFSGSATDRKARRYSDSSNAGGILAIETTSRGHFSSSNRPGIKLHVTDKKPSSPPGAKKAQEVVQFSPKSKRTASTPALSASAGKDKRKVSRNTSVDAETSRDSHKVHISAQKSKRKAMDKQKTNSNSKKTKYQHKPPSSSKSNSRTPNGNMSTKHKAASGSSKFKRKRARKNDIMGLKKTKQAHSFGDDYDFRF